MEYTVLFQDQHLLAIDKPAGILSVPPSSGGAPNIADLLRRRARSRGGNAWPVHRLDRDTSGVLLFARSEQARDFLERAFRERTVVKKYLALVHGRPAKESGTTRSFIVDRGKSARSSKTPVRGGREALTEYRILERFEKATLVEARPKTGRFNQIRLHMLDLGCPIVGDRKYSPASRHPVMSDRLLLHAAGLSVAHPISGKLLVLEAPLPADFEEVLVQLRGV
ncbi:MAG: RluA family pseudouridine synthase [Planctomycetota bacterium]